MQQHTYYGSTKRPKIGDLVCWFSDICFGVQTQITDVDEYGNVKVTNTSGWFSPKHFIEYVTS
jgi:hypothetical protein